MGLSPLLAKKTSLLGKADASEEGAGPAAGTLFSEGEHTERQAGPAEPLTRGPRPSVCRGQRGSLLGFEGVSP